MAVANKKAVSYSQIVGYETCPKQYYHSNIAKDYKQSETPQMRWGKDVHKALENRVKNRTAMPPNMAHMEKYVANMLKEARKFLQRGEGSVVLLTEEQKAVSSKLIPTGYFARNVWLRVIADLVVIKGDRCVIVDYKTGKRPSRMDYFQLKVCCAVLSTMYTDVKHWKVGFLWLAAEGATDWYEMSTDAMDEVWNELLRREAPLQESVVSNKFLPNPSGLCNGWCPVKTCEHWKPKRG